MDISLWSSLDQLLGAVAAAALVYAVAVTAVRLAGRRTLAQMSAFDIVVTIAIGTLVSSTALPSDASVLDGLAVLITLLLLQVAVAAARQRFAAVRRILDFQPQVLLRDGDMQLRRGPGTAQLTPGDLESRLRRAGVRRLSDVDVVVLEPTGKISVLPADRDQRHAELYERVDAAGSSSS